MKSAPRLILPVMALALASAAIEAGAESGSGFTIIEYSIDGGGASDLAGGAYTLSGTLGQPDAGRLTGGGFTVTGGLAYGADAIDGEPIPTVSQWGTAVMALLFATAGTILFRNRRGDSDTCSTEWFR